MGKTTPTKPLLHSLWSYQVRVRLAILWVTLIYTSWIKSQPFPVDTLQWSGPSDRRIDIVFFGDGYLAAQLDRFVVDAETVSEHLFSQSPFKEYRSYFNIVAIRTASQESGAAEDPEMPIDNYFGSTFNTSGIERLLTATKSSNAQAILFDQYPFYDQAVLVVNDDKYGGSGGWWAVTSTHKEAPEIALHEIGHSFAGLADEYWAGEQFAREKANMTQENNPEINRWKNWLGFESVEIYPHNENPSWFRPHQSCKMRVLDPPFCPVCKEAISKQIQLLVDPLEGLSPEAEEVYFLDEPILFGVQLLAPEPNTFKIDWELDNQNIAQADSFYLLDTHLKSLFSQQLNLTFVDTTQFVRDLEHRNALIQTVHWDVHTELSTPVQESDNSRWIIYPNPASHSISIARSSTSQHPTSIQLTDLLGRVLWQGKARRSQQIDISWLSSGQYQLTITERHQKQIFLFVKS